MLTSIRTLVSGAKQGQLGETIRHGYRNRLSVYLTDNRRASTFLPHTPDTLVVEMTNRCNQKCVFCPTGLQTNTRPKGKMSRETFESCIQGLTASTKLQFAGFGEPFLNESLESYLDLAGSRGITDVELYTNLAHPKEDRVRGLLGHPFRKLIVSLDAMDRETYMPYKRVDHFDQAFENVKILADEVKRRGGVKQQLTIQMLLTKKNEHQQALFVETIQKLGLTPNIKRELLTEMVQADDNKIQEWHVPGIVHVGEDTYSRKCPFIWRMMIVFWNGDCSICCHDPIGTAIYGNIRDGGTATLFNRHPGRQARRQEYFDSPSKIDCCRNCEQA